MKSLDLAIAEMKSSGCVNCILDSATFDDDGSEACIMGNFCSPAPQYAMIQITAYSLDGKIIWNKECDTGKTCTIPFTSPNDFRCYNN